MRLHRRQMIALLGTAGARALAQTAPPRAPGDDILIVYLTRTRNTEGLAKMIQSHTGGTLAPLVLRSPYLRNYQAHVDQVAKENEADFLPPLVDAPDAARFGTVLIGFPTWGMQLPPPVKSWLNQTSLLGKRVLPFNTHAGFGVGSGFTTLRTLAAGADVRAGLSIEGGYEKRGVMLALQGARARAAEREAVAWLRRHGIVA